MQILRNFKELSTYLNANRCEVGCLADTGFLYGLAYKDDRLFEPANDVHDLLSEKNIPVYANVISRMEFVDLIFRKQVTIGCVQIFKNSAGHNFGNDIFNLLKDIRDKDSAAIRKNESYKVDEGRLKRLRKLLVNAYGINDWKDFCSKFVGQMLSNEWIAIEEDLGLNFIEILEGQTSPLIRAPVEWADMVAIMGEQGLRGPDAMIVNLFLKSKFPLLITSDADFEVTISASEQDLSDKTILFL
jgi:predicted nucleic acid-binding protein